MSVQHSYFKFRDRFDFSPHRYDIGRPIFQNKKLEDNFFLLKIYELAETEYSPFYKHHLNFYLHRNPEQDETFFKHVYDVVTNRIQHFKRQDPFSSKYEAGLVSTRKLEAFLDYLRTVDRWHKMEPIELVIGEKDNLINKLYQRIAELESQLAEATKYDAAEKIVIDKGGFAAFIDAIKQFPEKTMPNGNRLVRSQTQSPWYKMIAKYFQHGDKPISIDTARNYFPDPKKGASSKHIEIAEEDKLFELVTKPEKDKTPRRS